MKFWNMEPVTVDGEKILDVSLFGEIDAGFFSDGSASKEISDQLRQHADAKKIKVSINSVGGALFGGIAIYNALRGHGARIETRNVGLAASAASVVLMAGHTVAMDRGSMLMIHNPSTLAIGDANDLRQTADVLDKSREGLIAIYAARTGKKAAELRKLLDAETWYTAEEAKANGFVDQIESQPVKVKNTAAGIVVNSIMFSRGVAPMNEPENKVEPKILTRAELDEKHADLGAKIFDEGRQAGIAAERARIKAIDEIAESADPALITAAKYDKPVTAEAVAIQILKDGIANRPAEQIAARARETALAGSVRPSTPKRGDDINAVAKQIAEFANSRRR